MRTSSTTTSDSFTYGGALGGGFEKDGKCVLYADAHGAGDSEFAFYNWPSRADHWQSCCWPPTSAVDTWHIELKDGWVLVDFGTAVRGRHSSWAFLSQDGKVGHVSAAASGASGVDVNVEWWTDHLASGVGYSIFFLVEGPAGVEFADSFEASRPRPADPCRALEIPRGP